MSIAIKVPVLPFSAPEARVGHWYRKTGVIARGEILVELLIRDEILPILAPQAGIIKRIFFEQNDVVTVGAILAILETGLPDLMWDPSQGTLIANTYRNEGVTTSMEYELRQKIRQGEAKFGKGFGTGLALPQNNAPGQEQGYGAEAAAAGRHFKANPKLKDSSQFSGNFKDPRVNTIPSNPEAQRAPQNAPTLGASPQLGPRAPTLKPQG